MPLTTRSAELVLTTREGTLLGSLPPLPVPTPWWNHAEPVVQAAREAHGIDVTILRLLSGENDPPEGGCVTYLAETASPCDAVRPWRGALEEHSLRHPFARPGGPAADLAWADACLAAQGRTRIGPAAQVRTWCLSSLWRLPVDGETLWLKVVPPFFAHEGALLARLAGQPVPAVLGHEGGRMLMAEIPGEDFYNGASLPQFLHIVSLLVEIQALWMGREPDLLALGLPDWRLPALGAALARVLDRTEAELPADDARTLRHMLDGLPALCRDIDSCGLAPTLIHGDFHPGNMRGAGLSLTLLDWGDSGVSHPLLDQMSLLRHVGKDDVETVRDHWHREWRRYVPGSDPARASRLLMPLAAAYQAVIRQRFLDNIEPAEHFYHLGKRAVWLSRAADLYRTIDCK